MHTRDLSSFWDELVACEGDVDRLLELIARRASEAVGEATIITTLSEDGAVLEPAAVFHPDPAIRDAVQRVLGSAPAKVGYGIAGTVADDRRAAILPVVDPADLAEMVVPEYRGFIEEHPIRSLVVVPMLAYGEVLGTLGVMRLASRIPYVEEDVLALEALAERASLALADAKGHPGQIGPTEYQAIFRHSLDGVLFTSPDGAVHAANPAACAILQRSEAEICRLGRRGLVVGDDPRSKSAVAQRRITGSARAEMPMRRGDGTVFVADVSSTVFVTPAGEMRACVIFRDATEQVNLREALEQKTRELARLAEEDDLTQVRNRRGFMLAASQALAFADRERVPVRLAFFDLDELKRINDTYGHRTGDAVLGKLAAAIAHATRAVDVVARLGGDEFVALLFDATDEDAARIVERVREALAAHHDGLPPVTFTVGVEPREPGDDTTLDDLLHGADQKMYGRKLQRRVQRVPGS